VAAVVNVTDPIVAGSLDSTDGQAEKIQAELERELQTVDLMLSMQARLRDRRRGRSIFLLCLILLLSIVGVAFAFAEGQLVVDILGVRARRTTWLGLLASLTLFLSLVELVVDPSGEAGRRDGAVRSLGRLKSELRAATSRQIVLEGDRALLVHQFANAMEALPPIPERVFCRLKAEHLSKREVSRVLSQHPGMSYRKAKRAVRLAAPES
jgi:hypothetical protein